jgi:hypothetical protein
MKEAFQKKNTLPVYNFEYKKDNRPVNKTIEFINRYKDSKGKEQVIGDDEEVSCIGFDGTYIKIIFVTGNEKDGYTVHIGKYNVDNNKIEWDKFSLDKDSEFKFGFVPAPSDSVLIGDKYYLKIENDGLGEINIKNHNFTRLNKLDKECKSIVNKKRQSELGPLETHFTGVYNGILFLYIPYLDYESVVCAIKDGNILGSIHQISSTADVLDDKNKQISKVNFKDNVQDPLWFFPKYYNIR